MKSQLAQYQLDNMTILDIMMNTLSAAEKLVFRDKEGKKYAYYDEGNSGEWKDTYQLVKELQIQKECLQSMIQLYNKNSNKNFFEFPCNLSKEQIIEDLILLRDQAMILYQNNYMIKSIYNDIISVIDCKKCPHYTVEQIYSKEKNNIVNMDIESVRKTAKTIIDSKDKAIQRDKENEEIIINNGGKPFYKARLFYHKKNFKKDDFYKNFYDNMK